MRFEEYSPAVVAFFEKVRVDMQRYQHPVLPIHGKVVDRHIKGSCIDSFRLLRAHSQDRLSKPDWENIYLIDVPTQEMAIPGIGLSIGDRVAVITEEYDDTNITGYNGSLEVLANITTGRVYRSKSCPDNTSETLILSSESLGPPFGK